MRRLSPRERARTLTAGYCTLPQGVRPDGSKPKKGWSTKSTAKRAMKAVNAQKGQMGRAPLCGVYLCRCGLWHATSKR